jgi:predicted ATPase/class 3 adenylate cyclase
MSEIRALLLTDVVDSTKLSEKIGDAAMAAVWLAHDRVARDLLPPWRGREIDKTDGMLFLFEAATDAVGYALAYHRALASLPVSLKARAGLHVGPVILRENTAADIALGAKPLEVEGLAKPTAARVMSLARGGQTLLTPEARAALGETTLQIESHGHWMIKGIAQPVELFEAGEPDAPFEAPPDSEKLYRVVRSGERWLPVKQLPNNLPQLATSFVGRERELDDIRALLGNSRLITLLGMGGLGKTRLSLQVAAEAMAEYPDGTWFLDLSPIRDPALVVSEAAQVLDVREEPDRPLIQTLCAHLKSQRALIILDNCEHLIAASAQLAHAILKAAPGVRMMASSREPLHVPGERTYPILPLPVPSRGDGVEALSRSTAVRLFVERAQAHKPAFEINEREAAALGELVAHLEGIPLAIELAAARVRSMSVSDINARLKDRYKLLTGGSRVLQERQQTLRALVDWSYDLLNEQEQCVLARLGVFAGGFDLGAAEEVCGAEPLDSLDVLDLLGSLVEKSLVMLDESGEAARYRMLETIRDYASEKLKLSDEQAAVAERHCLHFFAFSKQVREGLLGSDQALWLRRAETEVDNLRSAIALPLSGAADAFMAVKFCVALMHFWILRGYTGEGRNTLRAALVLPEVQASNLAQAHALYVGAGLAESQSDHAEALQMLETCLDLRRELGNPEDIATTLSTLSLARLQVGDSIGAASAEYEALELFRRLGHRIGEAVGLIHLGQIEIYAANDEQAREHLENSLAIARDIKHREAESVCELMLGEAELESGDLARAGVRIRRSFTICQESGDKRGEATAQWWLGRLYLAAGSAAEAHNRLLSALLAFRAFEMHDELVSCLEDHAELTLSAGQAEGAIRLAAAAATLRSRLNLVRSPRRERRWVGQVGQLKAMVPAEAFDAAWAEGSSWETDAAVKAAMTQPA